MWASECDIDEVVPASPWPFDERVEDGLSYFSTHESFVEVRDPTLDVNECAFCSKFLCEDELERVVCAELRCPCVSERGGPIIYTKPVHAGCKLLLELGPACRNVRCSTNDAPVVGDSKRRHSWLA